MQPWATVTGRLVDQHGAALSHRRADGTWRGPLSLTTGYSGIVMNADPEVGEGAGAKTDADGRFRIDKLVPGQRYSARIYRGFRRSYGTAFQDLKLRAGEVRDLGDIRAMPSVDGKAGTKPAK